MVALEAYGVGFLPSCANFVMNALMRADCISRRYLVQEGHHCKILQENSEPGE